MPPPIPPPRAPCARWCAAPPTSPIETPIFGKTGLSRAQTDEFLKGAASQIPLRRVGTADEVAGTAVFLASEDSSFITGSEIAVDGGLAQV